MERYKGYNLNPLSRFFNGEKELQAAIDSILGDITPPPDQAEIFRLLSAGKGKGKPHASGKDETDTSGGRGGVPRSSRRKTANIYNVRLR